MPFAEINGVRYHYKVSGQGDPVLLITGLEGAIDFWDDTTEMLKDRFTVIAVDNRGAGLTEYEGDFTLGDMAEDAAALIEYLDIGPVHVLGWSMGSHIAMMFAANHPELTRTLTIVSSYKRRPSRSAYILNISADEYRKGTISEKTAGAVINTMVRTEGFFRHMEESGRPIKTADIGEKGSMLQQMKAVNRFDFGDLARRIDVPVLSVHGLEDIMTPPHFGDELADEIEGCQRLRVPGEGHILRPKTYIPRFIEFISS